MSGRTGCKLVGDELERAIRMRDGGMSFAKIGAAFGISESAASNAVLIALCPRKGFRPAERDANGNLLPDEIERLRLMLRKGMKGVDIQLRIAVSASSVAEERRRYNRDLKARGKALLPPAGGGMAYSGARIPKERSREVERLLLTGLGGPKVSERTGVSKTHVVRIRAKLVRRLARKGDCLPGCDIKGKRRRLMEQAKMITEGQKTRLLELLMQRVPVNRAARLAGIGSCSAYRLRNAWMAEGIDIPPPKLPGRILKPEQERRAREGLTGDTIFRFRALAREHGDEEAWRMIRAEQAAVARRPLSFEEQLERVRKGAALVAAFKPSRADPEMTLGGIATAQVAASPSPGSRGRDAPGSSGAVGDERKGDVTQTAFR